jgi:hypothetical protein
MKKLQPIEVRHDGIRKRKQIIPIRGEWVGDRLNGLRSDPIGKLSLAGRSDDNPKYEVIACIGGRGFGVRREDMKKMIFATRGKVFTIKTLNQLVACTRLKEFKSR